MFGVSVVSVRGLRANALGVEYVGRAYAGWRASPLANPFRVGRDGTREEVIEKYRRWLWGEVRRGGVVRFELRRLAGRVVRGEEVVLGCWCFPLPCHAEVVRRAVLWLVREEGGAS